MTESKEVVVSTERRVVNLYEVVDTDGIAVWGGTDSGEALFWLRRKAPAGSRIWVSSWDEDGEEAWLEAKPIDITRIVVDALGRDW